MSGAQLSLPTFRPSRSSFGPGLWFYTRRLGHGRYNRRRGDTSYPPPYSPEPLSLGYLLFPRSLWGRPYSVDPNLRFLRSVLPTEICSVTRRDVEPKGRLFHRSVVILVMTRLDVSLSLSRDPITRHWPNTNTRTHSSLCFVP